MADDLDVERLFGETIEAFGGVDVVVHAVTGRGSGTSVADCDLVEFEALCWINTRATFLVTREAVRRLRDGGSIVNVTGSAVDAAPASYGVDAASGAAALSLTRVLALELSARDIRVNAVSLAAGRPCARDRAAETVLSLIAEGDARTGEVVGVDLSRSA